MKKLFAVIGLFLLLSCQIEYDGGIKYVVQTKVIDKDGNPIANVPLQVTVSVNGLSDYISLGKTNQNGNAELMFPPPVDRDARFSISYDKDFNNFELATYFGTSIFNINHSDFKNYLFNTGTIVLYKNSELTLLTIIKEQTSENTQITALSTTAITAENGIDFNPEENIWYPYSCNVLKNQTFFINYKVTNFGESPTVVTEYSEEVTVGTEPLEYTLTY